MLFDRNADGARLDLSPLPSPPRPCPHSAPLFKFRLALPPCGRTRFSRRFQGRTSPSPPTPRAPGIIDVGDMAEVAQITIKPPTEQPTEEQLRAYIAKGDISGDGALDKAECA